MKSPELLSIRVERIILGPGDIPRSYDLDLVGFVTQIAGGLTVLCVRDRSRRHRRK